MKSKEEKWVITIDLYDLNPEENYDKKLFISLITILRKKHNNLTYIIKNIDATGKLGNALTHHVNENKKVIVNNDILKQLLTEEGQLIDFDLEILKENKKFFRLIVSDNQTIDILGTGEKLPTNVLGKHKETDPALFYW